MSSIQPDSPGRGAAAFLPQPLSPTDELVAAGVVETIYYYNCRNVSSPYQLLADIEYRSSDRELDTRRHVFRWDLTPYNIVFQNGFEARRQMNTTDSTYYNLERYVNYGGRPLDTQRPTTHAFISTTLSSQWHPTVGSGQTLHIYRYEIYAPGGIWVTETLDSRYRYPSQDEVAFPAGIAPQYIRSAQLFVLTGDGQYTRRRRADTFLYINTNFNPQSNPQRSITIQRPIRSYRDTDDTMKELTIVEYTGRSTVKRAGVESNGIIIEYYIDGVTQIDTYIDSAFRSTKKNEAYMFFNKEYALINYAPGANNDFLINGPLLIGDGFPSLAGTAFAEYGIDASFGCHDGSDPSEAFIFSGNLCAKINFAPGTTDDRIIEGPKTIKQMFPFFKGTKFENGVDAAFESTVKNEAYLFKGSEYARINYSDRTLGTKILIVDGFKCFQGTKFSSDIGAAFASHRSNEAYLFKDTEYVLLYFTPGKTSDYIVNGPKPILNNWSSLKNILPRKNKGLDIYADKHSLVRDQDD